MVSKKLTGKPCLLALTLWFASSFAFGSSLIPWDLNEQVEFVEVGGGVWSKSLETTIYKPSGDGPFPLVVINHGKASGDAKFQERARYFAISREFLKMGYVVAIPMRSGFSKSSGVFIDNKCNTKSTGYMQADEIAAFIDAIKEKKYVDMERMVAIGQSTGGLAVMALATRDMPGLKGVINFAGGYKYEASGMNYCNWQEALLDAFRSYGKEAKIPSIWFYGDNDSYWGAELPSRMKEAYASGSARLVLYGAYPYGDAHRTMGEANGIQFWIKPTKLFLQDVGMPSKEVLRIEVYPVPKKASMVKVEDIISVPYIAVEKKTGYEKFLQASSPRAFAISKNGYYGWSNDAQDAAAVAMLTCQGLAKEPCELYAVDNNVVWQGY